MYHQTKNRLQIAGNIHKKIRAVSLLLFAEREGFEPPDP